MKMTKKAVLHIPDASLLELKPIEEWVRAFSSEDFARTTPTEIALPAVGIGGPSYDSRVHPYHRLLEYNGDPDTGEVLEGPNLPDWIQRTRELYPKMPIWAYVNPVFAFLDTDHTRVVDQYGNTLDSNMCIANDTVHKLTDLLVDELLELGIDGVVFDLTDIYPQSGSNIVTGLQNTCFCSYCLDALAEEGYRQGPDPFMGPENPFRLLLKPSDTGTAHIPISSNWSPKFLLQMSEARGFVELEDSRSLQDAKFLTSYLQARSQVVGRSVKRLGLRISDEGKKTAAILGDKLIDLSTMTDVNTLQQHEAVSEFWVPEVDRKNVLQHKTQVCAYLFPRSTYHINAFFESVENTMRFLALRGQEHLLMQMLERSRRLVGNGLSPGSALAASLADELQGFVGVPLAADDIEALVSLLFERVTGDKPSEQLLDAIGYRSRQRLAPSIREIE